MEIIMQICVYPNWHTKFDSQNGGNWSFFYETKASIHLSQGREWVCGAQSWKERDYILNPCLSQLIDEL